jgi:hypothetical membrane protein
MNEIESSSKSLLEKIPYFICGILGSSIIMIGFLIPGLVYRGLENQTYSIVNYFVSELGYVGMSQLSWLFNISLIIGGTLLAIFLIGLSKVINTNLAKIACIIGVISAIATSFVGIFPMNTLIPHFIAAMTFFYGGMVTVVLYTIVIFKDAEENFPKLYGLLGIVIFIFFFIFNFIPLDAINGLDLADFESVFNNEMGTINMDAVRPNIWYMALMEWLVTLGVVIWMFILSLHLFIKKK